MHLAEDRRRRSLQSSRRSTAAAAAAPAHGEGRGVPVEDCVRNEAAAKGGWGGGVWGGVHFLRRCGFNPASRSVKSTFPLCFGLRARGPPPIIRGKVAPRQPSDWRRLAEPLARLSSVANDIITLGSVCEGHDIIPADDELGGLAGLRPLLWLRFLNRVNQQVAVHSQRSSESSEIVF